MPVVMEDDVDGSQDDDSHPTKRSWIEGMALDDEETQIASGLEPILLDQDETGSQDADVDEVDHFGGDGRLVAVRFWTFRTRFEPEPEPEPNVRGSVQPNHRTWT